MPKNEQNLKWPCAYCTYENWLSAIKCTLCSAPRPAEVICPQSHRAPGVSEDIYHSADNERIISSNAHNARSADRHNHKKKHSEQEIPKWRCAACTFENWPKTTRCAMCQNNASKTRNSLQPEASNGKEAKALSPKSSRSNSKVDLKTLNNDKNKAQLRNLLKWQCPKCTYENWPKTSKCVICSTTKPSGKLHAEDPKGKNSNLVSQKPSGSRRRSPTSSLTDMSTIQSANQEAKNIIYDIPASDDVNDNEEVMQIRNRLRDRDWTWLSACIGISEGDASSVETYLNCGGDRTRQLTREDCMVLNRPGIFEVGYTLVHLAIRFKRDDLLAYLLAADVSNHRLRSVPCLVSPDLAADIRKEIAHTMRQKKGDWPCYFFTNQVTFLLPAEIPEFPPRVRRQLFEDILDKDVHRVLEDESPVINWSAEITEQLGSRVFPLWNRSAGDCLLDSILQATYGVFDKDNTLRKALFESLSEGSSRFFARYKEWESMQAETLQYSLDEDQFEQDWASILSLASQPGTSLEQTHVFALAHILRRPVIIYGVKYVKSFRGETLGLARFQGVYLPLLWERSFCWKNPVVLGYTRGHFSALVAMEIDTDASDNIGAHAHVESNDNVHVTYLPLVDHEGRLLPVHFLSASEVGSEEVLLRDWLDCCVTEGGVLVAQQRVTPRPVLMNQMIDDWLDRYRKLSK